MPKLFRRYAAPPRLLSYLFFATFVPAMLYARKVDKRPKAAIQQITINDKSVEETIRKYIRSRKKENELFGKGYGYIRLFDVGYGHAAPVDLSRGGEKETKDLSGQIALSFRVSLCSIFLDTTEKADGINSYYPPYYTYVDGVLVLVFLEDFHALTSLPGKVMFAPSVSSFEEKSKKKLRRLMFPYLQEALKEDFVFESLTGETFILSRKERGKLTEGEILQKATFTLSHGIDIRVTRAGEILETTL